MDLSEERNYQKLFSKILDAYDILTGQGNRKPYSSIFIHTDGKLNISYESYLSDEEFEYIWKNINFDWNDKLLVFILEKCFSKHKYIWKEHQYSRNLN